MATQPQSALTRAAMPEVATQAGQAATQTAQTAQTATAPSSFNDSFNRFFGRIGEAVSGVNDKVVKPALSWANTNPMAASMLMQGLASSADPSQRDLRESQTNANNAQTTMVNQRLANSNTVGNGGTIAVNYDALRKLYQPVTNAQGLVNAAYGAK